MTEADYLKTSRRELTRLRSLAERAMAQVDDAAFFREPGEGENGLAILVKHMSGNMRSRWTDFLTSDGEKPDRRRDGEFEIGAADSRDVLMADWAREWGTLFDAIDQLAPADLSRTVTIRGEPHSVLEAIQRQLAHYAYHVGQIVQLARHLAGESWSTLSIPRGHSVAFNADPGAYLRR